MDVTTTDTDQHPAVALAMHAFAFPVEKRKNMTHFNQIIFVGLQIKE